MTPTEVIACPACRHTVRVPTDWLGQTVQCPECKATFTAPVREGGRLTEPVLLSATPRVRGPSPQRNRVMLRFAGAGLVLVGVVSFVANALVLSDFLRGPDGGKEWLKERLPGVRQLGLAPPAVEGDEAEDDRAAAELAPRLTWVWPAAMGLAALSTAGGVCLVRRKGYRLAQLGCAAAALNVPHLCCIPGAVCGFWGMLALLADEGFGQPDAPSP
ncbi:MAG: hypothetical protein U0804_19355 [Gemmataceae bacterium]